MQQKTATKTGLRTRTKVLIGAAVFAAAAAAAASAVSPGQLLVIKSNLVIAPMHVVMGSTSTPVFSFGLNARNEGVMVNEITVSDYFGTATTSAIGLAQAQLFDGDKQIGTTSVFTTQNAATGTSYAKFTNLNLTIPNKATKYLKVIVGAASGPWYISGSPHKMMIFGTYDKDAALSSIKASGLASGTSITYPKLVKYVTNNPQTTISGRAFSLVATKLKITHASDTPNGASSAATGAVVAKFTVFNSNNTGAGLKLINLDIATSILQGPGLNTARTLKIYKIDTTGANLLASAQFNQNNGQPGIGDTEIKEANFKWVWIGAGESVNIIVTLDTNDAKSGNQLIVGLDLGDIIWTDGFQSKITQIEGVPLKGKVLVY